MVLYDRHARNISWHDMLRYMIPSGTTNKKVMKRVCAAAWWQKCIMKRIAICAMTRGDLRRLHFIFPILPCGNSHFTYAFSTVPAEIITGTDIVLHHAIGRVLIEEGYIDNDFINNNTEGYEKYAASVMQKSVEEAAIICGVDAADIRLTAKYIGNAKGFITMWTMGLNQSVVGVNKNLSLINLIKASVNFSH